jgi:two-component system, LytTR family, sensor kinase
MKNKLYWQCQLGGWGIIFIYETITNYFCGRDVGKELPWSLLSACLGILFTHLYRIFVLKKHKWSTLTIPQLVHRMFVSSVVIGSLLSIYQCIQAMMISQDRPSFHAYYFLVFFIATFSFALNWNLIYFMGKYIEYNEKLSTEKIEMQLLNKNLELTNIKLNLQPHFIFNALNSIRSLIIENQGKAREAVMQLSNILRNSLISDKAELVTLQSEFDLVKDYLSLENVRYEERLKITYQITETCLQSLIPPMLLQTLVENAIKHGIAVSPIGGKIILQISECNTDQVIITIENTGQYLSETSTKNNGFGLEASLKRLQYLFGKQASLTIKNTMNNTVIVHLQIPK